MVHMKCVRKCSKNYKQCTCTCTCKIPPWNRCRIQRYVHTMYSRRQKKRSVSVPFRFTGNERAEKMASRSARSVPPVLPSNPSACARSNESCISGDPAYRRVCTRARPWRIMLQNAPIMLCRNSLKIPLLCLSLVLFCSHSSCLCSHYAHSHRVRMSVQSVNHMLVA